MDVIHSVDYLLNADIRRKTRLNFERQQVSKALLNLKWKHHIQMGCEQTGRGHREDICALDIDDGDEMIILASYGGSITVTRYKNLLGKKWKKSMKISLEEKPLKTIDWCPIDLRLFMLTSSSGWMRVCDVTMEREIQSSQFDGEIHSDWNEYNTRSSRIAVADGSALAKIIDFRVGMGLPQVVRWEDQPIDVVQWYPSKQHYLYAGRRDGSIGVFDIRSTQTPIAYKRVHNSRMYELRISSDGLRIISADRDGYIHLSDTWDFSNKALHRNREMTERPFLEVMEGDRDLFVATNCRNLSVLRFKKESLFPEVDEQLAVSLRNVPFKFRKSSLELITGSNRNYLNILSFDGSSDSEQEEDEL